MKTGISLTAVGHASSLFLALMFSLCVAFDLLFPNMAMFQAWRELLPGFTWLTWPSFFLGLVESYAYGWYFALIWVPLYNVFATRRKAEEYDQEPLSPRSVIPIESPMATVVVAATLNPSVSVIAKR